MEIKMQVACVCILVYLAIYYVKDKHLKMKSSQIYRIMFIVALFNLVFDCITVYTINHLSQVPMRVNRLCHQIFILSLDLYIFILYQYLLALIQIKRKENRGIKILSFLPILISIPIVCFGELNYHVGLQGSYSYGVMANTVYATIAFYLFMTFCYSLKYWKHIEARKRTAILHAVFIMSSISLYQLVRPFYLLSGLGVTLIIICIYLSLENPTEYTDKGTGTFNRYGFSKVYSQKIIEGQPFAVLTIVIEDWELLITAYGIEFANILISSVVSNFEAGNKISIFYLENGCFCVMTDINEPKLGIEEAFARKLDEPWHIEGEELHIKTHMQTMICLEGTPSTEEVLIRITDFSTDYLKRMAYLDSLTGLRNRNALENDINYIFRKRFTYESIWFLVFDINNLKVANDQLGGHASGDMLIKSMAKVLSKGVSNPVGIYRMGGDEFAILLTNKSEKMIHTTVQNLEINRQKINQKQEIQLSFAVGYSQYDSSIDSDLANMIKRADDMMYQNKAIIKLKAKEASHIV